MMLYNIYFKSKNKCKLCYIYSFFYTFNLINVTTIEYSAFRDSQLTGVTIPDSVTYLSCYAFDGDTIIHKSDSLVCNDSCSYKHCIEQ